MQITSEMVRELRDKTGAGMMDCKKALAEAGGSMEGAVDVLRKRGLAAAARKAARVASEGLVACLVEGRAAALVEINCETDFVAKTDEFQALAREVAGHVLERDPAGVEQALDQPAGDEGTLADLLAARVAKVGEKISLRRFARFAVPEGVEGLVASYVHAGGKIGVLVELHGRPASDPEAASLGKDLAMQVAAANPSWVSRDDVPAEVIARERSVYREQALAARKPEKIVDRIAEGKIEKFYEDTCLLDQPFIRDPDRRVKDLLAGAERKAGAKVRIARFVRFQVGEGMEKRADDLAAEVAKQLGRGPAS